MLSAAPGRDRAAFEAELAERTGAVLAAHPTIPDHRERFPWLTGGLGDPFAPCWFIAENPSLSQLEKLQRQYGETLTADHQWFASNGDRLFREALVEAGLKSNGAMEAGGWRCYVTNLMKGVAYAGEWKRHGTDMHRAAAVAWQPVLEWQLSVGRPRRVVLMGKTRVVPLARFLARQNGLVLPAVEELDHYSYVALNATRDGLPPMHPDRVAAYKASIRAIAERAASDTA